MWFFPVLYIQTYTGSQVVLYTSSQVMFGVLYSVPRWNIEYDLLNLLMFMYTFSHTYEILQASMELTRA